MGKLAVIPVRQLAEEPRFHKKIFSGSRIEYGMTQEGGHGWLVERFYKTYSLPLQKNTKITMSNRIRMFETKKKAVRAFTPHYFHDKGVSFFGRSRIAIVSKFKDVFGKNSEGFTLIEVMVVVAIMGIMAIVSIVSLGNGRIERELEANAREFAGVVREAQNYALTGKQIGGGAACSFSVSWDASTYSVGYTPSGNCGASPLPIVSYALKNGVTFSTAGNLSFSLPWADLDFNVGSRKATFTKQLSTYTVCIYADGRISDQRGAACP